MGRRIRAYAEYMTTFTPKAGGQLREAPGS